MRPLIALTLAVLILSGVYSYLRFAETLRGRHAVAEQTSPATGHFSADITLTFAAEADAFAIDATSLIFKQQQRILLVKTGLVPAGEPLVIDPLPDVIAGDNAFYFECIPRATAEPLARAVRVRIFRDGELAAEQTLWSEPGQVPRGEIHLNLPRSNTSEPVADHDH
ncbi:MAG TPA: hypothetical protein VL096_12715 [Pirellulaceae bacterium]|nr:hypothetical protein [Pirellulaceae bacterium]